MAKKPRRWGGGVEYRHEKMNKRERGWVRILNVVETFSHFQAVPNAWNAPAGPLLPSRPQLRMVDLRSLPSDFTESESQVMETRKGH